MFFDWLSCYQDFDFELPIVAKEGYVRVSFEDGSQSSARQDKVRHDGSFSTFIDVKISGNRIYISGNPSRFDRLDNLFGFTTLDQCFTVYNRILESLGLPLFTQCTSFRYIETVKDGRTKLSTVSNGAVITSVHLTTNIAVGATCELAYLKAVAMLPYRHSVPRLHTNGMTVDWVSKLGKARDVYPKIYNKANELRLHLLPDIKRRFGEKSDEYDYVSSVINYCEAQGAVRLEQELHSSFLKKNALQYWGLSDFTKLEKIHKEFTELDKKLKVSSMNLLTLTETLLEEGICSNTKAANFTALYALNWMNGEKFDESKSQVKIHRSRLRKIGIDILKPCNLLIFSPVIVKEVIEIEKKALVPPSFYRHPNHLRLVA